MPDLSHLASDPARSRGRRVPLTPSDHRTTFERDRDRIIHSAAFRRMKHKTQVFVSVDGDHYRTRLTHSLEVAQIARSIAGALRLDVALTEALALAHDLGHPPFGHAGESALDAAMAAHGGFDHNAHTLRVLTVLEQRYARYDGLNLSWETLEGLAKHNGPVARPTWALAEADAMFPLDLGEFASLEAQVAAIADDIAYDAHDIDDGLRARLFRLDALTSVPEVAAFWNAVKARFPSASEERLIPEMIRDLIGAMVADVIAEAVRRTGGFHSVDDVRSAAGAGVGFSAEFAELDRALKRFLTANMYQHPGVARVTARAADVLGELYALFAENNDALPADWRARLPSGQPGIARHIGDYIAGMTDRYALREHHRMTGRPFML